MTITGKAWKFGDDISTDLISPGRYFHLRSNLPELTKHVLEDARKDYSENVKKGDFVVAGRNFGLGSSREQAPVIIKMSGASAIFAKSFARIFYRNCINIGLPAIICDTNEIDEGDILEVDLEMGKIVVKTKTLVIRFPKLSPVMARILDAGGLIAYVKKYGDLKIE
uniref:3-isopropylmalate dehydratase small subunit n=1 Tax=uncultured marine thaumarchaeote KM3_06_C02 TaxID=1455976 RepID=A0A075G513_9ARCH|nr:putative 3-isopropylmalate dehydratase small subunit (leuD) [uncultured marine thaumarchaeote KM3_06_C02]